MGDTALNSYPIGGGKIIPVDHTGPASYTTGGETLGNINNMTGISVAGLGSLDMVLGSGSLSESGNYEVKTQQTGLGSRKTFNLLWYAAGVTQGVIDVASSGSPSGMTAGTYPLVFVNTGTGGSGAAGTITVTTSAVTAINITNPGSGYTSAPTVSAATGGTPPTLTATIGSVSGGQVASGTNLSGETVRLGYMGK